MGIRAETIGKNYTCLPKKKKRFSENDFTNFKKVTVV